MTPAGQRRLHIATVLVVIGLLVWAVAESSSISVLVAFTAVVTVGLFLAPKPALAVIAVFLLAQPALVNLAGGSATLLGMSLHRLHEVFAVAAGARVAVFIWWKRLAPDLWPWVLLLGAFILCGAGSGAVQQVPVLTVALGGFLAIKFALFVLLAMTIPWTERDCDRLMRIGLWLGPFLLGSALVVGLVPAEVKTLFVDKSLETDSYGLGQFQAMQGIFPHPAVFGWASAVAGCYGVAALLVGRRKSAVTVAASIGSAVVGILASLRRKPLAALPLAAVYGVIRFSTGRRRWVALALFIVVGYSIARIEAERLKTEIQDLQVYIDPTAPLAPRILLYITGVEVANAHFPLGAGFGRFGGYASVLDYSPIYDEYGLSSLYGLGSEDPYYIEDTYWPHIAAETGWLGTLVLLVLYVLLLERAARVAMHAPGPATKALAVAACLAMIEGLIESGAGPMFEEALFALAVGVPLGVTLVRGRAEAVIGARGPAARAAVPAVS